MQPLFFRIDGGGKEFEYYFAICLNYCFSVKQNTYKKLQQYMRASLELIIGGLACLTRVGIIHVTFQRKLF
jgi:hypothetical protein